MLYTHQLAGVDDAVYFAARPVAAFCQSGAAAHYWAGWQFSWTHGLVFPMEVQRLLPWSYYGLFALVGMDWDAATLISTFYWREPQMLDAALFALWFSVFFVVGRTLFVRKEV